MADAKNREVAATDALAEATKLYECYVELARLAEVPLNHDEVQAQYNYDWSRPLGLTMHK